MTGDNGQTSININHIPQNTHSILLVKDPYFSFSHQKIHLINQWTFQNLSKWSYCRYCPIEGHFFVGIFPYITLTLSFYIVMCSQTCEISRGCCCCGVPRTPRRLQWRKLPWCRGSQVMMLGSSWKHHRNCFFWNQTRWNSTWNSNFLENIGECQKSRFINGIIGYEWNMALW